MSTKTASTAARPVHEIRLCAIKAAVWRNETSGGVRHSVTFARLYKDDENAWKQSTSFGRDDLLLVAKVADLAHDWICRQGQAAAAESVEEEVHF